MLDFSPDDRQLVIDSGLFDAKWYSQKYPDVAMLGMDAIEHYLWLGALLGRDPSEHFSTSRYLAEHFDVAAAGVNPLLHYLRWGRAEGRDIVGASPVPHVPVALADDVAMRGGNAGVTVPMGLPVPFVYRPMQRWSLPRIGIFARGAHDKLAQAIGLVRSIPLPFTLHVVEPSIADANALRAMLPNWGHGKLLINASDDRREAQTLWADLLRHYPDFDYALTIDLGATGGEDADKLAVPGARDLDGLRISVENPESFQSLVAAFETDRRLGFLSAARPQVATLKDLDPSLAHLARGLDLILDDQAPLPVPPAIFWTRCAALGPLIRAWSALPPSEDKGNPLALAYVSGEIAGLRHCALTRPLDGQIDFSIRSAKAVLAILDASSSRSLARSAIKYPIDDRLDLPETEAARKMAFKQARLAELEAFMARRERFRIPSSDHPKVSIIAALYNSAELTLPFLRSLVEATRNVPCEVILVDNASTDLTRAMLKQIEGIDVVLNDENLHFLRAVNGGAEISRGEYILLLNNDTLIPPDAIELAVADLEDRSVGAVGGKLILPDGSLQEAGSIIWNDGSCLGYGRGKNPKSPAFQFMRDVDYCSGAFLMFRRDLFEDLGRLDEKYVPAYYEEVDLCMRIHERDLRIVYDPRIEIRHFEFGSASTSQQAVDLQIRNHRIFRETHRKALNGNHRAPSSSVLPASNRGSAPRILFLDDRVPFARFGSGFPRSQDMILSIHRAGWDVTMFPMTFPEIDFEEFWREYPPTIEVAGEIGRAMLKDFLEERRGYFDAILVSRPHNMGFLTEAIDAISGYEEVPIVYDAEAIFVEREVVRRRVHGIPFKQDAYRAELDRELSLTKGASIIAAVSERERGLFEKETGLPCYRIGHKALPRPTPTKFSQRRDILFVGPLTGSAEYSPNVDSLLWFVKKVAPILDKKLGQDWNLLVVGRVESAEIEALSSDRVRLFGMVPDLREYFDKARIFIAPTRFAAGIPIKAYEAASHGLPIVATDLIATQLDFVPRECILSGDSEATFAEACAELYTDESLWYDIREGALSRVAVDCSSEFFDASIVQILRGVARGGYQSKD